MQALLDWLARTETEGRPTRRPLVTLSYAQSLDGCLTVHRGQPLRLSGPESSRMTHLLRATHEGILVGIGTVLADDPRLNVRLVEGRDPRPVVLDTRLRIPVGCRLLQREANLPWVLAGMDAPAERCAALQKRGARVIRVDTGRDGRVDLRAALARLADEGLSSLMVEGGAGVIAAFLRAGLVDRAVLTIASVWLGGLHVADDPLLLAGGTALVAPGLVNPGSMQMGADLVVWGWVKEREL